MDSPKRLEVLKRLCTQLETITVVNGYQHDLTGRIWRGRDRFGEQDEVPMVSVLESARGGEGQFAGYARGERKEQWTVFVQGWAREDRLNPTDSAYLLAADVEKSLAKIMQVTAQGRPYDPAVYRLGGLINHLDLAPPVIRPPDEISAKSYFYMPLRVDFSVNLVDPFCLH